MNFGNLCMFIVASSTAQVKGHGYIYWPHSRQYLANNSFMVAALSEEMGVEGLKTKWGYKPPMQSDERWAHELCGNNAMDKDTPKNASYAKWAGPPVAAYKEGGQITFTVVMAFEHGGIHEFRLCPKQVSDKLSLKENAKCIDSHFIGRMCTPHEKCGCNSERCRKYLPHKDPKDKLYSHGTPFGLSDGAHVMKFNLPKGVSCDQCTVQWYWETIYGETYRNCMDIRIKKASSRRRRRSADKSRRRRRRSNPRRRETTPAPTPAPSRRRRRSCQDSKSTVVQSADPNVPRVLGKKWADLEYDEYGCFPLVEGDKAAEKLPPTAETLRDLTCMKHDKENVPCRSGLPFYRLHVHPEAAVRLCFSFCSSKGLDLFGLVGEMECRCGATPLNQKFWKKTSAPDNSLVLDHGTKLPQCSSNSVKVYRYSGWMKLHDAAGVQDAMIDVSQDDSKYMDSIIAGPN